MKYLIATFVALVTIITTIALSLNNECITLGEQLFVNISFGSCEVSDQKTSISTHATLFWVVMNVLFAVLYPKPTVPSGYKVVTFIFGFPTTGFTYLIAKTSSKNDKDEEAQA